MNAVFTVIIIASLLLITAVSPETALPSLLTGAENAAKCALTLFCVYAVWMGVARLAEKSGLARGAARALKPVCKRLFKTENEAATESIAMNLSCNLLGIGGAATPYAVKAIGELERENNGYAQRLLFVINATSVQILPTTVIALRSAAGSAAAFDIFFPSLLATAFSTAVAVLLYVAGEKLWR